MVPPVMDLFTWLPSTPSGSTACSHLGQPPQGHLVAKLAALAAAQVQSWNHTDSPLSLNTHIQVIDESCWIFLQNMPRSHLLLRCSVASTLLPVFILLLRDFSGSNPASTLPCPYRIIPSIAAGIIL